MLQAVFLDLSFCAKLVLCCSLQRNQSINQFEVKDGKKSVISKNFENYRICKHKPDIFGSSLFFLVKLNGVRTSELTGEKQNFLIQI